MSRLYLFKRIIAAAFFIILTNSASIKASPETESYYLANGMQVILKENHSSPMISSMVFVRSGSKYETRYENGITHFLEHYLFDGTTSLSRQELDEAISDLGGYNNAFTRKDLTAYLILLPKQYIEYGMALQSDMLFHSTIPDSELGKERKVVIEEINRSADSPGAPAEDFFQKLAYAGTPYGRPVLGYKAFIENIPREAIVDYWKRYYRPSNMTLLVIGDFLPDEMKAAVDRVYGIITDSLIGLTENRVSTVDTLAKAGPETGGIVGQEIHDTVANVTSTYISFSFTAPHFSNADYLAVDLLSQYLSLVDISPLMIALKGGANPMATEASVSLRTYSEFSRLNISVITDAHDLVDSIKAVVLDQIGGISGQSADPKSIDGLKTSVRSYEVYNSEKLHYYGFMIAPMMMTTGWNFIQDYADNLDRVTWADCQAAASKWYSAPEFIATIVRPAGEDQIPYESSGMTAEEVTSHFDSVKFKEYDLDSIPPLSYPATDSVRLEIVDKAVYHLEELANGMTVIIKSQPEGKVFAMNILGRDRTINEPDGKAGITDFVNRCLEKGTVTRDGAELSRDLTAIGANVTLVDNPWIPYDDRYTSRRFSFMKFETIDQFAEKGFHLFSEMILHPAFDSSEVENVRQSMLSVLKRNSGSPGKVARDLFYRLLFEDMLYGRPIMGYQESISSISRSDLKEHHFSFYSPENMILSIVSGRSVPEIMSWVDSRFGQLVNRGFESQAAISPITPDSVVSGHVELEKEQISIMLGSLLPGATSDESTAISVATSILSGRLYLNLREKQGLAYSVGAGIELDQDFGWSYCRIGTGFDSYQDALDGIMLQIEKLRYDGPTQSELNRVRNRLWGRLMSSKLSSINQAYYMGLGEHLGTGYASDATYFEQLAAVSTSSIRRIFSKYFSIEAYILASAGKRNK